MADEDDEWREGVERVDDEWQTARLAGGLIDGGLASEAARDIASEIVELRRRVTRLEAK
jgi:hypothetical protein